MVIAIKILTIQRVMISFHDNNDNSSIIIIINHSYEHGLFYNRHLHHHTQV